MDIDDEPQIVYTTLPSLEEAERMGRTLVERRLAACVNILPGMVTIFRWNGAVERADEVVMMVQTTAETVDNAMEAISELHPLELPALLAIPVAKAGALYGAWIAAETASVDEEED